MDSTHRLWLLAGPRWGQVGQGGTRSPRHKGWQQRQ